MPVNAVRFIRKMRGGAQAHLLGCDDGQYYVVKFVNNPQHRRILVNEWLSSVFLKYLQVACPETAVVNLSAAFLEENPEVSITLGASAVAIPPGWHFGSRCPGDPVRTAIYDYVPDALLGKVANLVDFLGVLVFDKWMSNADSRQSIFYRARIRDAVPRLAEQGARLGFVTQMMDHGYVLNGPHWDLPDSPIQGLYFRRSVYASVRGWDDFQPWLDRVVHFPEEVVDDAWKSLPPQWISGEESQLYSLLERLMKRRKRVPELIRACAQGPNNPFPMWTQA